MSDPEGWQSFQQTFSGLSQWASADCVAGPLVSAGITDINIEDDQGIHVRLIVRGAEGRTVGGRGILNRTPVKVLTVISIGQASAPTPSPVDSKSFTSNISPSQTRFITSYASHRRWRFLFTEIYP